jgi:single-strand DNA-binding protein
MNGLFMTVEGVVGTEPRKGEYQGTPVLSFRLVSKERRWDKSAQSWQPGHASWMTVSCFRQLARNVAGSISKGDLLIVHGKVRVKEYVNGEGQLRTVVDVEATSIGHDLKFGTTRFRPSTAPDSLDDRLREQADAIVRELADLPEESVEELLAERAARAATEPDPDDDEELVDVVTGELLGTGGRADDEADETNDETDDEADDDEDDDDEDDEEDDLDKLDDEEEAKRGRRQPARSLAGAGRR